MRFETQDIEGLVIIKPRVFEDERGHFFESYNKKMFEENGLDLDFIQDNQSLSQKGVLRGLHFQAPPFSQGKLIRVIQGSVLDIAVDIRTNSKTYGKYYSIILSEQNKTMFYIPKGFAHGFLTLQNNTIFTYKCTDFYSNKHEHSLRWDDPTLNINWGVKNPILSDKDKESDQFSTFVSPF